MALRRFNDYENHMILLTLLPMVVDCMENLNFYQKEKQMINNFVTSILEKQSMALRIMPEESTHIVQQWKNDLHSLFWNGFRNDAKLMTYQQNRKLRNHLRSSIYDPIKDASKLYYQFNYGPIHKKTICHEMD